MNSLADFSLETMLPASIKGDENIRAIAKAVTEELLKVSISTELLQILAHLDELPDTVIDQFAWQLHVDFYDISFSREKKKVLLYQAIAWHRRKGTVSAVEEIVTAIHGTAKVVENWDYAGKPYHFKIIVDGEAVEDINVLNQLKAAIDSVKNVRSWLDTIEYQKGISGDIYMGGATYIHKEVMING